MAARVKVAVITGTSSGVGAYLSAVLAKNGYLTYATMRTPSQRSGLEEACHELGVETDQFDAKGPISKSGIRIRAMDVAHENSISSCLEEIFHETERVVDVCVNNAGYSEGGGVESFSLQDARKQFETNFFGLVKVTQMVIPLMRERESGKMIAVSSVGGVNGVPFNDVYCASKFAVEGLYESMAPLYKAFNVSVTLVEPGPIASKFVQNAHRNSPAAPPSSSDGGDAHPTLRKLKSLEANYIKAMTAGFQDPTRVQTSEDVARSIYDHVIAVESPDVRHQTNRHPMYVAAVANKLADPTGNKSRDMMHQRFFAEV